MEYFDGRVQLPVEDMEANGASDTAKEFISQLLKPDLNMRPSAQEGLGMHLLQEPEDVGRGGLPLWKVVERGEMGCVEGFIVVCSAIFARNCSSPKVKSLIWHHCLKY
jgi:hypothetical protein